MKQQLMVAGFLIAGTLMSGCAVRAGVVAYAPPPPRYAVVGAAPGAGFVWTEGFYDWRGSGYVWVPGRWQRPPRARAVWVPGNWEHGARGYYFHRGYWR